MSDPKISVCVCTYNPDPAQLEATLRAIAAQQFPAADWEALLIDNASVPPLADRFDATAVPGIRLVNELRPGLVHARQAALAAARGAVTVFFDDDNRPAPDYLSRVWALMQAEPALGVLGGRRLGLFEREPAPWMRGYYRFLAVADPGDAPRRAGQFTRWEEWMPAGAGMALRREAAAAWLQTADGDPRRRELDRIGTGLGGSGDVDMVARIVAAGWQAGYDPGLRLEHFIPARRLEYAYLRRLVLESMASYTRLLRMEQPGLRPRPWPLEYPAALALALRAGQRHPRALRMALAEAAGRYAGHRAADQAERQR